MKIMNMLRQTGRTQRMLEDAFNTAIAGRPVCIIVSTEILRNQVLEMVNKKALDPLLQVYSFSDILKNPEIPYFNLGTMSFDNSVQRPVGEIVYVDHDILEKYFGAAIKELHRWDRSLNLNEIQ